MNIMRKSEKKVQTKQKKIREITVQRKKYNVKSAIWSGNV